MNFKLEEARKKNIYGITYLDKNDNKTYVSVPAYSEKQAIVILKKTQGYKNVYRILDIECIEDNSIDDGEQLSLFSEDMKFKVIESLDNKITSLKPGDKFLTRNNLLIEITSIDKKPRHDGYIYVNHVVHTTDYQGRPKQNHYTTEYNFLLQELNELGCYRKVEI